MVQINRRLSNATGPEVTPVYGPKRPLTKRQIVKARATDQSEAKTLGLSESGQWA